MEICNFPILHSYVSFPHIFSQPAMLDDTNWCMSLPGCVNYAAWELTSQRELLHSTPPQCLTWNLKNAVVSKWGRERYHLTERNNDDKPGDSGFSPKCSFIVDVFTTGYGHFLRSAWDLGAWFKLAKCKCEKTRKLTGHWWVGLFHVVFPCFNCIYPLVN